MGPLAAALIPGIAQIGSALIGGHGQSQANEANAREAQKNRDFQERMRSTQYQTAVDDMRKAGLNPALAYMQGGAGTPGGATAASMQNPAGSSTAAATSAIASYQELRRNAAEIDYLQKQTTGQDTQNQILLYKWMSDVLGYQVTKDTLPDVIRRIKAESRGSEATAREADASARIRELGIPEAEAIAQFYRSAMGKFSPYINSGSAVLRGIGSISRRFNFNRN